MRTTLGPSRSSCCLDRLVSASDVFVVTSGHARSTSYRPMRWPRHTPRGGCRGVDPGAEGLRFNAPVKARCDEARRRLPSSHESASRNPQTEHTRTKNRSLVHPRTRSPSLHPCPASGGASGFLPASALPFSPRGLATSQRTRRAMRPIDLCHPNELRAPTPRSLLALCHHFRDVDTPRSLGSARLDQRIERFHDARIASADREAAYLMTGVSLPVLSVGVFFPRLPLRSSL